MSSQLLRSRTGLPVRNARLATTACRQRTAVFVRAEGRVVREYREEDDTVVDARVKAPQQQTNDLYVKSAQLPQQKRLSKEVRSQLMNEYVGLGGAENKAMSQNWFLYMMVFVSSLAVACKMIGAL